MTENTTDYKPYLVELATTFQATGKQKDAIIAFESTENLTLDESMKLVEMYVQESKKEKRQS